MTKQEITTAVLIFGLTLAFLAVSFGVYLSKGKSPFWVSKKLKLGAWLLTLSALGNQACEPIEPSCYSPLPTNVIEIHNEDYTGALKIDLNVNHKITGVLYGRNGSEFSFAVTDSLQTDTVQIGQILPADGVFDNSTEEIVIELDTTLQTKTYYLYLYEGKSSNQTYPMGSYLLDLKNED